MHREILRVEDPTLQVDHINGNRLDNRRANLRIVTNAQNGQNRMTVRGSSQYRGVAWHKRGKKWSAQVVLDGQHHYLGLFDDELEAARVAANFRAEHMPFAAEARA